MEANLDGKDDFLKAVDSVEKKHKKPSSLEKKKEEKLITVKSIDTYKNNEIAVTLNRFLSKNVDKDAGEILFGENLARSAEYYGMKSNPLIGLLISGLGLVVIMFRKLINKKKSQQDNAGGDLKNEL